MRDTPPRFWSQDRSDEHIRKVTDAVRGLLAGKGNNAYRATLAEGVLVTEVVAVGAEPDQIANLTPLTALAAAEAATTYAIVTTDKITINHVSGGAGREFGIILQG